MTAAILEDSSVASTPSPVLPTPSRYEPRETRRMYKNVIVVSISFTLLFTAYSGMSRLQASLWKEDGLGNWISTTVYATMVGATLFLPSFVIQKLSAKWTMFCAMFGYMTVIAAQFYGTFYTLIPAGFIVGICASNLWTAKSLYLTHLGNEFAELAKDNREVIIVRFFGIFFMTFQTQAVFGNIISSVVLSSVVEETEVNPEQCGANFCPETNLSSSKLTDSPEKLYSLLGIYLAIGLSAAAFLGLLLDPLTRYGEKERKGMTSKMKGKQLAVATFKQMKKPYQILIIPLTIWSGLEQGFLEADYTAAYITCGWGIEKIGFVLICYGVCDAAASICFDPLIRYIGRAFVFFFAATINLSVIITFLMWTPSAESSIWFFVFAGLWGIADAAWQCGINAYYGVLFPSDEEASFSNYRLWESIGFVIAFVESNLVCVSTKLYILIGCLVIGLIGFVAIELKERKRKKEKD